MSGNKASVLDCCVDQDTNSASPAHRLFGHRRKDFLLAPWPRLVVKVAVAGIDFLAIWIAVEACDGKGPLRYAIAACPLGLVMAKACGLYSISSLQDIYKSAKGVAALGLILISLMGAACVVPGAVVGWHQACAVSLAAAIAIAGRLSCGQILLQFSTRIVEHVFAVGRPEPCHWLAASATVREGRVVLSGQLALGQLDAGSQADRLFGNWQDTKDAEPIIRSRVDRVIVLTDGLDERCLWDTVHLVTGFSKPVYLLCAQQVASGLSLAPEGWLLLSPPLQPDVMAAKRVVDIAVSSLVLLGLCPLMLLIGLAIKLDSPGPILFRQARLGLDNKPFTVLKFRTMFTDAEATDGSIQAVRGDRRVTRVGALLRKLSLDELPQLLNVLNNTMSLVGPRPHPTELNRHYAPLIANYAARHRVIPGITGWAQVNGLRGETPTVEIMRQRVEHDLAYIRDHSIAFDLWILLRTVVSIAISKGVY